MIEIQPHKTFVGHAAFALTTEKERNEEWACIQDQIIAIIWGLTE